MCEEHEPDSRLSMYCPHCAAWYAASEHPYDLSVDGDGKVTRHYYCDNPEHGGEQIELKDAAATHNLTPWQEWKRDQLIAEMQGYERQAQRILDELNNYYMYGDGW